MLRYKADLQTIFVLLVYAALVVGAWTLAPLSPLVVIPLVAVICLFSWFAATIAHNTVHCPVFKNRTLNRVFQVWVTLSYGFSVSEFVPGHNLSHHKFTQQPRDLMRTDRMRFGWNLLNLLLFAVPVGYRVTRSNMRYAREWKDRRKAWYRQFLIETYLTWGLKAALLLVDWRKCLLFVVVPHLFAVWGITTINFLQHDGCDPHSEINGSRNFTSPILNFFTCNNGYHTIHHIEPGLHWSLLPAAHAARVRPEMDPRLEERSLLAYLWRTFVWPGKRVNYDGTPLVLPPRRTDDDWVPTAVNAAEVDLGATA